MTPVAGHGPGHRDHREVPLSGLSPGQARQAPRPERAIPTPHRDLPPIRRQSDRGIKDPHGTGRDEADRVAASEDEAVAFAGRGIGRRALVRHDETGPREGRRRRDRRDIEERAEETRAVRTECRPLDDPSGADHERVRQHRHAMRRPEVDRDTSGIEPPETPVVLVEDAVGEADPDAAVAVERERLHVGVRRKTDRAVVFDEMRAVVAVEAALRTDQELAGRFLEQCGRRRVAQALIRVVVAEAQVRCQSGRRAGQREQPAHRREPSRSAEPEAASTRGSDGAGTMHDRRHSDAAILPTC